jgi:hypothetical protein
MNVENNQTSRFILTFADRYVADEWWRAVSTSGASSLSSIRRISSQFYSHDARTFNALDFFSDNKISDVAQPFRRQLFVTLLHDHGGRELSIIPPITARDFVSGEWFRIRSKWDTNLFWEYSPDQQRIRTSNNFSMFRIVARDVPEGTIMIRKDIVSISVMSDSGNTLYISTERDGYAIASGTPSDYSLSQLDEGRFIRDAQGGVRFSPGERGTHSWELV